MQNWQQVILVPALTYFGIQVAATAVNTALLAFPAQKIEDAVKANPHFRLFVYMASAAGFDISDTITALQVWLNRKAKSPLELAVEPRAPEVKPASLPAEIDPNVKV